jgi:hypothetical protein
LAARTSGAPGVNSVVFPLLRETPVAREVAATSAVESSAGGVGYAAAPCMRVMRIP